MFHEGQLHNSKLPIKLKIKRRFYGDFIEPILSKMNWAIVSVLYGINLTLLLFLPKRRIFEVNYEFKLKVLQLDNAFTHQ